MERPNFTTPCWRRPSSRRPQHAVPLMPEFIAKQDGAEKQDCERNAAKRWLTLIVTGEGVAPRLSWRRSVRLPADRDAVLAIGADSCSRPSRISHKTLYDFMNGATLDEVSIARKEGAKKLPTATAGSRARRCARQGRPRRQLDRRHHQRR